MNLEDRVSELHSGVFFEEFSFSRNDFYPTQATAKEFADQAVYFGEALLVYQLKQRDSASVSDEKTEGKWWKNKVLKTGVDQIYDTLTFLKIHNSIDLTNQKGHVFNFAELPTEGIHKVILFQHPSVELLQDARKYQISKRAGFIHIVSINDYSQICHWLYTPKEIATYFGFRSEALSRSSDHVTESALLGQYLLNELEAQPCESFSRGLETLIDDRETYDIRNIISGYRDRVETLPHDLDTSYYPILFELAKLKRNDLRCFKERYVYCAAAAMRNEYVKPTRFYNSRLGFVFSVMPPMAGATTRHRLNALENFTFAAKLLGHLDKQIGLIFERSGNDCLIDWMYVEEPWAEDEGLAKMLKTNNPFREVKEEWKYNYFHQQE